MQSVEWLVLQNYHAMTRGRKTGKPFSFFSIGTKEKKPVFFFLFVSTWGKFEKKEFFLLPRLWNTGWLHLKPEANSAMKRNQYERTKRTHKVWMFLDALFFSFFFFFITPSLSVTEKEKQAKSQKYTNMFSSSFTSEEHVCTQKSRTNEGSLTLIMRWWHENSLSLVKQRETENEIVNLHLSLWVCLLKTQVTLFSRLATTVFFGMTLKSEAKTDHAKSQKE